MLVPRKANTETKIEVLFGYSVVYLYHLQLYSGVWRTGLLAIWWSQAPEYIGMVASAVYRDSVYYPYFTEFTLLRSADWEDILVALARSDRLVDLVLS